MSSISADVLAGTTFDYVIVGGGTAGLTVAARLTENPSVSVAVLEAGEDRSEDLPVNAWALTGTMLGDPKYDWAFQTVPQVNVDNRVIPWPRGKQLGGSSGLNFWFWNHPSQDDLNSWAKLGNEGWTWRSLFPYFLKAENYNEPSQEQFQDLDLSYLDGSNVGDSGPIETSFTPEYGSFDASWTETFENLKLKVDGDPYGGRATGGYCTLLSQNLQNASRSYATTAYYKPNAKRPNLKVLTGALANKILFNRNGRGSEPLTATGVDFTSKNKKYVVRAKREVILSAGTTQSPQLLELSGIGNKDIISALDITVLVNNPGVGENLQDHAFTSLTFEAAEGVNTLDIFKTPGVVEQAIQTYLTNRTGLLTQASCSVSYLSYNQIRKTSKRTGSSSERGDTYPDGNQRSDSNSGLAKQYEIVRRKLRDPQEPFAQDVLYPVSVSVPPPTTGQYVTLLGLLSHPFSRGSIHINSSDPAAYPAIDPKFLSNPIDLELLSTIAFHLQTVGTTEPFASLLKNKGTVFAPGTKRLTNENVKQHVKNTLGELQHPTGTCAMLPRKDGGVVDSSLLVYGTRNLRVVDASIIPIQPVGTIQALVYAIAEKAADIIKAVNHTGKK